MLLDNYWTLPETANTPIAVAQATSVNRSTTLTPGPTATVALPTVSWTRYVASTADLFNSSVTPSLATATDVITIGSQVDTWPTAGLSESDLRELLLKTVNLHYTLEFWAWDQAPDDGVIVSRGCYIWRLEVVYDFHARGQVSSFL